MNVLQTGTGGSRHSPISLGRVNSTLRDQSSTDTGDAVVVETWSVHTDPLDTRRQSLTSEALTDPSRLVTTKDMPSNTGSNSDTNQGTITRTVVTRTFTQGTNDNAEISTGLEPGTITRTFTNTNLSPATIGNSVTGNGAQQGTITRNTVTRTFTSGTNGNTGIEPNTITRTFTNTKLNPGTIGNSRIGTGVRQGTIPGNVVTGTLTQGATDINMEIDPGTFTRTFSNLKLSPGTIGNSRIGTGVRQGTIPGNVVTGTLTQGATDINMEIDPGTFTRTFSNLKLSPGTIGNSEIGTGARQGTITRTVVTRTITQGSDGNAGLNAFVEPGTVSRTTTQLRPATLLSSALGSGANVGTRNGTITRTVVTRSLTQGGNGDIGQTSGTGQRTLVNTRLGQGNVPNIGTSNTDNRQGTITRNIITKTVTQGANINTGTGAGNGQGSMSNTVIKTVPGQTDASITGTRTDITRGGITRTNSHNSAVDRSSTSYVETPSPTSLADNSTLNDTYYYYYDDNVSTWNESSWINDTDIQIGTGEYDATKLAEVAWSLPGNADSGLNVDITGTNAADVVKNNTESVNTTFGTSQMINNVHTINDINETNNVSTVITTIRKTYTSGAEINNVNNGRDINTVNTVREFNNVGEINSANNINAVNDVNIVREINTVNDINTVNTLNSGGDIRSIGQLNNVASTGVINEINTSNMNSANTAESKTVKVVSMNDINTSNQSNSLGVINTVNTIDTVSAFTTNTSNVTEIVKGNNTAVVGELNEGNTILSTDTRTNVVPEKVYVNKTVIIKTIQAPSINTTQGSGFSSSSEVTSSFNKVVPVQQEIVRVPDNIIVLPTVLVSTDTNQKVVQVNISNLENKLHVTDEALGGIYKENQNINAQILPTRNNRIDTVRFGQSSVVNVDGSTGSTGLSSVTTRVVGSIDSKNYNPALSSSNKGTFNEAAVISTTNKETPGRSTLITNSNKGSISGPTSGFRTVTINVTNPDIVGSLGNASLVNFDQNRRAITNVDTVNGLSVLNSSSGRETGGTFVNTDKRKGLIVRSNTLINKGTDSSRNKVVINTKDGQQADVSVVSTGSVSGSSVIHTQGGIAADQLSSGNSISGRDSNVRYLNISSGSESIRELLPNPALTSTTLITLGNQAVSGDSSVFVQGQSVSNVDNSVASVTTTQNETVTPSRMNFFADGTLQVDMFGGIPVKQDSNILNQRTIISKTETYPDTSFMGKEYNLRNMFSNLTSSTARNTDTVSIENKASITREKPTAGLDNSVHWGSFGNTEVQLNNRGRGEIQTISNTPVSKNRWQDNQRINRNAVVSINKSVLPTVINIAEPGTNAGTWETKSTSVQVRNTTRERNPIIVGSSIRQGVLTDTFVDMGTGSITDVSNTRLTGNGDFATGSIQTVNRQQQDISNNFITAPDTINLEINVGNGQIGRIDNRNDNLNAIKLQNPLINVRRDKVTDRTAQKRALDIAMNGNANINNIASKKLELFNFGLSEIAPEVMPPIVISDVIRRNFTKPKTVWGIEQSDKSVNVGTRENKITRWGEEGRDISWKALPARTYAFGRTKENTMGATDTSLLSIARDKFNKRRVSGSTDEIKNSAFNESTLWDINRIAATDKVVLKESTTYNDVVTNIKPIDTGVPRVPYETLRNYGNGTVKSNVHSQVLKTLEALMLEMKAREMYDGRNPDRNNLMNKMYLDVDNRIIRPIVYNTQSDIIHTGKGLPYNVESMKTNQVIANNIVNREFISEGVNKSRLGDISGKQTVIRTNTLSNDKSKLFTALSNRFADFTTRNNPLRTTNTVFVDKTIAPIIDVPVRKTQQVLVKKFADIGNVEVRNTVKPELTVIKTQRGIPEIKVNKIQQKTVVSNVVTGIHDPFLSIRERFSRRNMDRFSNLTRLEEVVVAPDVVRTPVNQVYNTNTNVLTGSMVNSGNDNTVSIEGKYFVGQMRRNNVGQFEPVPIAAVYGNEEVATQITNTVPWTAYPTSTNKPKFGMGMQVQTLNNVGSRGSVDTRTKIVRTSKNTTILRNTKEPTTAFGISGTMNVVKTNVDMPLLIRKVETGAGSVGTIEVMNVAQSGTDNSAMGRIKTISASDVSTGMVGDIKANIDRTFIGRADSTTGNLLPTGLLSGSKLDFGKTVTVPTQSNTMFRSSDVTTSGDKPLIGRIQTVTESTPNNQQGIISTNQHINTQANTTTFVSNTRNVPSKSVAGVMDLSRTAKPINLGVNINTKKVFGRGGGVSSNTGIDGTSGGQQMYPGNSGLVRGFFGQDELLQTIRERFGLNIDVRQGEAERSVLNSMLLKVDPINTNAITQLISTDVNRVNPKVTYNETGASMVANSCVEGEVLVCKAVGKNQLIPGMVWWCFSHCKNGICPPEKCSCVCETLQADVALTERGTRDNNLQMSGSGDALSRGRQKVEFINLTLNGSKKSVKPVTYSSNTETVANQQQNSSTVTKTVKTTNRVQKRVQSLPQNTLLTIDSTGNLPNVNTNTNVPNINGGMTRTITISTSGDANFTPNLNIKCVGINAFEGTKGINEWCTRLCSLDMCPAEICSCVNI